jgi:putative aldouronate transport system permease protein
MARSGTGPTELHRVRWKPWKGRAHAVDPQARTALRLQTISRMRRMQPFYVLLLPSFVLLIIFKYIPIYGVLIAFKDFNVSKGILGSPWNNFRHYVWLFTDPFFFRVLFNTVWLSILRLIFEFPAPILLALLLNEIRGTVYKRVVQTVSYLPHFISWVILASIIREVMSPQRGIVGFIYTLLGQQPVNLLINPATFRGILVTTSIWQSVGWGTIIFLAALSSVDPGLYESASIDGANRWQKMVHITLPSLMPAITILFILQLGSILNASFDQIFNLYNPLVYPVADVFDTYMYRIGIEGGRYDYTTAVGLFKNVVGVLVLLLSNVVVKRYSEYGIW